MANNDYDDYSRPDASDAGRHQYTGQESMGEFGYDYQARNYSPNLDRLVQPDPIGFSEGSNVYEYTNTDPLKSTYPIELKATRRLCSFSQMSLLLMGWQKVMDFQRADQSFRDANYRASTPILGEDRRQREGVFTMVASGRMVGPRSW